MKRKSAGLLIDDEGGASNSKTMFLLIKAFLGTGIIFLGKAFYVGGIVPSVVMIAFSAFISNVAGVYLVKSAAVVSGTYQDIAGHLYGPKFKKLVLTSLGIGQLCYSMTYVLFIAGNVKDLVSTMSNCKYQLNEVSVIILAELVVFIPMILMRNMKSFSNFALAGNATALCAVAYILYNDFVQFGNGKIEPRLFTDFSGVIMIFNISIMAYSGIGLLIPIRQAMATPKAMPKLITVALIIMFLLYTLVGGLSALAYGKSIETIILLNMPSGIILQILQIGYVFAITVSVPLQMFPAFEIFEANIFPNPQLGQKSTNMQELQRSILRVVIMAITCLIAYMFSNVLDLFVSLVGAFICIPSTFLYPPLLYLKASKTKGVGPKLMIGFALIAMVVSTGMTVMSIISGHKDEQVNRCIAQ
eukprot:NODE_74_length_23402_cov_1.166974.p4 type:complete len:416 gc:universal NODE_74_length_23402_cov_1.166974:1105-2352(+)